MRKVKIVSIVALALLVVASLIVAVCTDVKFDNPLDEKGTRFLFGDTTDRAGKIEPNDTGVAGLFSNPKYDCDRRDLKFERAGKQSETIYTNDDFKFKTLMGDGGNWDGLVTYDTAVPIAIRAILVSTTNNTALPDQRNVPAPGSNYAILYWANNPSPNACDTSSWSVTRMLVVEQYVAIDSVTRPVITLTGKTSVEVVQDLKYEEEGVVITWRSATGPITLPRAQALDSIKVERVGSGSASVVKKSSATGDTVSFAAVVNLVLTTSERVYTLTYYATAVPPGNGRTAEPVVRTVTVVKPGVSILPKSAIVLNNYTYKVGSETASAPDTAVLEGGGQYAEKGVARAYYVTPEGATMEINKSLVATSPPTPALSGLEGGRQSTVRYTLAAGDGYAAADDATRRVYVLYDRCAGPTSAPTITGVDAAVTLKAGETWDGGSWNISGKDVVEDGLEVDPKRIGVDYGTLNPSKLVAGSYTVKYVAVSGCGVYAIKTRTVTVTP